MRVVYKMTLLTNKKIYVGQHSDDTDNFDFFYKNYWGGGVIWRNYLKNLKDKFPQKWKKFVKKEILFHSKHCSQKALDKIEKHWIIKLNSYWNNGNGIGFNLNDAVPGHRISDETKKKLSKSRIGKKLSKETVEKIRRGNLGKKRTAEHKRRYSEAQKLRFKFNPGGFEGKTFSEESKRKISQRLTGLKRTPEQRQRISEARKKLNIRHTEEEKKQQSLKLKEYYRTHRSPNIGKHLSQETKAKISKTLKGLMTGEKNSMYGRRYITNGKVNKTISSDEKLPDGWRYGMAPKKKRK